MSFEKFMEAQIAAIEASGLEPEEWIERHAEEFRASHLVEEEALAE